MRIQNSFLKPQNFLVPFLCSHIQFLATSSVSHQYSFVISRMSQRWNHKYVLSRLSFIQCNAFDIYSCCILWIVIPFYCWVVFHCRHVPQFLYSPVEGHLSYLQLLVIMNGVAINIHTVFCANVGFYLTGVNTQEWNCWVIE